VGLSVSSAFLGLPGARQLVWELLHANPLSVAIALLVCLGILTVPLTPFDRERLLPRWRRRDSGPGGNLGGRGRDLDYVSA